MNTHKNARLVYARPHEMLRDILYVAAPCAAAAAHGVSAPTARKWPGRYLARGEAGGAGRFSRSAHSLRAIAQATVAGASTPRATAIVAAPPGSADSGGPVVSPRPAPCRSGQRRAGRP